MKNIYKEEIVSANEVIRSFNIDVDDFELKWHRDREDRIVTAINDCDWKIQLDDKLPILLQLNESILIPKGIYHRIIKGQTRECKLLINKV